MPFPTDRVATISVKTLGHRPGMHIIYSGWICDFQHVEFDGDEGEQMTFVYQLRGTDCQLHVVDC